MVAVPRQALINALQFVGKAANFNKNNLSLAQIGVSKSSLVATDNERYLAARVVDIPTGLTIPSVSVNYITLHLARNNAEFVEVTQTKTQAIFETPTFTARLKRLAVPFPEDTEEILLKPVLANTVELILAKERLQSLVSSLVLPGKTNDVITLSLKDNVLTMKSNDYVGNEAEIYEEVKASEDCHTNHRLSHFSETVDSIRADEIKLKISATENSPILVSDIANNFQAVLSYVQV